MIGRALLSVALGALWMASCRPRSEESCALPDTEEMRADDPYCRFYTGTAHYRAEEYAEAAALWRGLIDQEPFPTEQLELKWSSYNNVGYLEFYGLGVPLNRERALSFWRIASDAGQAEPKFHLCSAYGDEADSFFDPVEGLAWCKAAEAAYAEAPEPGGAEIPGLVRERVAALVSGMTAEQISESEARSRELRSKGARKERPKPPPRRNTTEAAPDAR